VIYLLRGIGFFRCEAPAKFRGAQIQERGGWKARPLCFPRGSSRRFTLKGWNKMESIEMSDDNKKWEADCEKVRIENEKLLEAFGEWLDTKKLKEKTIQDHIFNVDLFINHYLLYSDVTRAVDGAHAISCFFTTWFYRKAMWASERSVKQTAASLKKFYQYLVEAEQVDAEDLVELKESCRDDMPQWIEAVRRFDDLADLDEW